MKRRFAKDKDETREIKNIPYIWISDFLTPENAVASSKQCGDMKIELYYNLDFFVFTPAHTYMCFE